MTAPLCCNLLVWRSGPLSSLIWICAAMWFSGRKRNVKPLLTISLLNAVMHFGENSLLTLATYYHRKIMFSAGMKVCKEHGSV